GEPSSSLVSVLQHSLNVFSGTDAHGFSGDISAFQYYDGGDAHNLEGGGKLRLFIYIDLPHFDVASVLGDFVDDRGEHGAGAAPAGPEIQQNGFIAVYNFLAEILIGNMNH